MLFSSRVTVSISIRVRIRFNVLLVGGYAHVFLLLSVVIVTLPREGSLLQLNLKSGTGTVDGPQTAGLVIYIHFRQLPKIFFIWSLGAKCSVTSPLTAL